MGQKILHRAHRDAVIVILSHIKKKTDLIRNRKSQVQIQVYLHYMKVLLYLKWLVSAKTVLNDKNR